MDRPELPATMRAELAKVFATAMQRTAAPLLVSDLDGIEQRLQAMARTVLGSVVEQTVKAIAATLPSEPPTCGQCQQPMRPVDPARPRTLPGLVGDDRIVRPYFVCDDCHHGCGPLDERLGIGAGTLSPGLARGDCRLGIDDSFNDAVDAAVEALGIEPAGEGGRRMTERIGQVAEEVRKAISYFTKHRARMDYPGFVARQLSIGSGAVESACKTVIEEREKGAGMRWTEVGAQAVTTLRTPHRSGCWAAVWRGHPQRRRPAVFPRCTMKAARQPHHSQQAA